MKVKSKSVLSHEDLITIEVALVEFYNKGDVGKHARPMLRGLIKRVRNLIRVRITEVKR